MPLTRDREPRALDLIVWGATGFTGRLVARAVARRAPAGLRWAVAGRDRERLDRLRADLGGRPDVVVADAHDPASLDTMTRGTKAIVSTVGPFARHGTPLVAACVAAGTDYADVTGEPLWMRATIDAFHDRAAAGGVRIVHACGFDSVPSDLGVWRLQRAALERHGRPCRQVLHVFGPLVGGLGGGTIRSGLDVLERASRDPAARRALADPDLLAPGAARAAPARDEPPGRRPQRHAGVDGWTAPFAMAATNAKVVRRTRALLGEPWGHDVHYAERLRTDTWARAAAVAAATAAAPPLLAIAPVRRLAERVLPRPGEGPSETVRERGFFRTRLLGRIDGAADPVAVTVASETDPGYEATARMLAEMGLGLALGEFAAPGGVLTPAVVGGRRLIERLDEAGIRVRVSTSRGV